MPNLISLNPRLNIAQTTASAPQEQRPDPNVDLSWLHANRTSTGKHTAALIDLKREGQYRTVLVY
jgi:hypothetical protein